MQSNGRYHLKLEVALLYLFGCISLCCAQGCSDDVTLAVIVGENDTSFLSTDDIQRSSPNCTSSILWDIMTTNASLFTSIEILELFNDSPNTELQIVLTSVDSDPIELTRDIQRRFYIQGDKQPKLQLRHSGIGADHTNGSFGFLARLSLANEPDCGENLFCQNDINQVVCFNPSVVCDGQLHCVPGFTNETKCASCGETDLLFNNETATPLPFTSFNYPINYQDNMLCIWFITADAESVVVFVFTVFDLEQRYDTLVVGNGHDPSEETSIIVILTGQLSNVRVISINSKVWVKFETDYSITMQGFSGEIIQAIAGDTCRGNEFACNNQDTGLVCLSTNEVCNGHAICKDGSDERNCGECGAPDIYLNKDTVFLNSPGYPGLYPNDIDCSWLIVPIPEMDFLLRILEFELESGYDFVTFSSGESPDGPDSRQFISLTGRDISRRTLVWMDNVCVSLKTDNSQTQKGFSFMISNISQNTTAADLCQDDEFHCGSGFCVTENSKCNGFKDCRNYEDENECDDVFCPGSYKCDNFEIPAAVQPSDPMDSALNARARRSSSSNTTSSEMTSSSTSTSTFTSTFTSDADPSFDFYSNSDTDDGNIVSQCIPLVKVCDGHQDCPGTDDETECDKKRCPVDCECSYVGADLKVSCAKGWNTTILSGVAVTTKLLYLSGLDISILDPGTFKAFTDLKVLSLRDNQISEIQPGTFDGLDKLLWLDLSNTSLTELQGFAMEELSSLRGITIFDVPLRRIKKDAFAGLRQIKTLILVRNTKELPRLQIEEDAFEGLQNLSVLYVDDHRLCCFFPSNIECKTLEPEPPLFVCSELMPNIVLKVFMWILGISALIGNIFVMIWRCRENTEGRASRKVHSLLVFNLAVSDSLMGLYMLIIAGADLYFGKKYFEVSEEWHASIMCKLAGFVSIIASEASVFFLTLISVDRFLSIVFPFSTHHIRPKTGRIIVCFIWIGTIIVALVPTILTLDSSSDLYGLSDVCIGLPLMTKVTKYETVQQTIDAGSVANITVGIPSPVEYRASWFFSIALFLGVNLLCFCVIFICYICIFVRVKMSMKRVRRHKNRDDEVRMAIKMAAIVMTDFICWFPVIIMGILSQGRIVEIPPEAYAWIVVLILPINSSLNPYLYTISDFCSKQRRSASTKKRHTHGSTNTDNRNSVAMISSQETDISIHKQ